MTRLVGKANLYFGYRRRPRCQCKFYLFHRRKLQSVSPLLLCIHHGHSPRTVFLLDGRSWRAGFSRPKSMAYLADLAEAGKSRTQNYVFP